MSATFGRLKTIDVSGEQVLEISTPLVRFIHAYWELRARDSGYVRSVCVWKPGWSTWVFTPPISCHLTRGINFER